MTKAQLMLVACIYETSSTFLLKVTTRASWIFFAFKAYIPYSLVNSKNSPQYHSQCAALDTCNLHIMDEDIRVFSTLGRVFMCYGKWLAQQKTPVQNKRAQHHCSDAVVRIQSFTRDKPRLHIQSSWFFTCFKR